MEAKLQELDGMVAEPASGTADDKSKVKTLRSEIAGLEKISGDLAVAALAAKKAELAAIVLARREAQPLDTRAKDIERVVEAKRKAADKQAQHVADLESKLSQLQKDLAAAKAKELQAKEELATAEADKAVILRRVADEAAADANLAPPVHPKVVLQGLSSLCGQVQPAHCQHLGMSPEQIKAVVDMLAAMLQGPGPSSGAAAAIGEMAVPGTPQRQPEQPMQVPPSQLPPPPELQPGVSLPAVVPTEDDEEMLDEDLAAIAPQAEAGELDALRARLKENGLWIRNTRRKQKSDATRR
jgi:hypothetical protein